MKELVTLSSVIEGLKEVRDVMVVVMMVMVMVVLVDVYGDIHDPHSRTSPVSTT